MKYMLTWNERSQGSAIEYEKAQQRILDVFRSWEQPANCRIEMFVIRVGDWGGYMLVDWTTRSRCTSCARCCRLSLSRRASSSPSRKPCAANSRSWPGATI